MSTGRDVDTAATDVRSRPNVSLGRIPGHRHLCPCWGCYLWRDRIRRAKAEESERGHRGGYWYEYERRPQRKKQRRERESKPKYLANRREVERRRPPRVRPDRTTPEARAAAAESRRRYAERQAELLAAGLLPHGRVPTYAAGCRCPECGEAKAEDNAKDRQRRAERNAKAA